MTKPSCKSCAYAHTPQRTAEAAWVGLCFFLPPQVSVVALPGKPDIMQPGKMTLDINPITRYPQVDETCWCGQFEAKPAGLVS